MSQETGKLLNNYRQKLKNFSDEFMKLEPMLAKSKYEIARKRFEELHSEIYSRIFVLSLSSVLNEKGTIDNKLITEIEKFFKEYEDFIQSVTKYVLKAPEKTR